MKLEIAGIESSYRKNELGKALYDLVMDVEPHSIVEFGVLYGYSTVWMAAALRDLGRGRIYSYDLWDNYQYNSGNREIVQGNVELYGLEDYVTLGDADFKEWLKKPEPFDLIHIDVSNDGDTIREAYRALKPWIDKGAVMVFEGGTDERDKVEWMVKYDKVPITSVRDEVGYEVIDPAFPGLSVIRKGDEDDR